VLVLSALLMSLAIGTPGYAWVAWIILLPLFLAIRVLHPAIAALSGAVWGACLYFFNVAGAAPAIEPTLISLALLTAVPAVYMGLGTLLTRFIGFNPFMLALGWILVEVALRPLGLQQGLLAGTQSEGSHVHWVSRLLGYFVVAFLMACTNASLLIVLSKALFAVHCRKLASGIHGSEACLLIQGSMSLQQLTSHAGYPRAPPIPTFTTRSC
jgi:apolipoprotein N-acyltransferase